MHKIFPVFIAFILTLTLACGGGGSGDDRFEKLSTTTSLRIGRSASSSSPVATSASLDNGETVIVIFDPVTGTIAEVLFVTAENETIRIVVDPAGRPVFAETSDTQITFNNLDNNTSDILIEQNGVPTASLNIPFLDETVNLLSSEEILGNVLNVNQDDESEQRGFLNSAVVAVRTVGCAGRDASSQAGLSSSFSNLSSSACNSQILDEIVTVSTNRNQNIEEITVRNVPDTGGCNNRGSLDAARNCTLSFGEKIKEASQKRITGSFPTPTPKPQKPKPQDPLKTTFEGTWVGPITPGTITTFCVPGTLSFDISTNGDHTCFNPNCLIAGQAVDQFNVVAINGVLNHNADISFIGTTFHNGQPSTGTGVGHIVNNTTITGTFQNDIGCSGTFTVFKQ